MENKTPLPPLRIAVGCLLLAAGAYVWWTGHLIAQQPDRDSLIAAIWHHVGVGVLLLAPLLLALFLDRGTLRNGTSQDAGLTSLLRRWAARLFWINVALLMLTGPLTVWARGSTLKVFDWFAIPSPVERMQAVYEFLEHSHVFLANLLPVLFAAFLLTSFMSLIRK